MNGDFVKLTVLGSGSILSNSTRNCSSYFLKAGKEKFVIDFGTGAFKALQKSGETFLSVNNFFFSHFDHPDHVNDFVALVTARFVAHQFKIAKPRDLNVIAPRGFKNFFSNFVRVYPFLKKLSFKLKIKEVSNSSFKFKGLSVVSKKVKHTNASVGYRFSFGKKTITYSGDTGYCKEIVELCSNANLAVLECSLRNGAAPQKHLNAEWCARIAKEANSSSLLLTHIYPYLEKKDLAKQAKKYFNRRVLVAKDGMVLNI